MRIKKTNGSFQEFMPNKILTRIKNQANGLKVDSVALFQKVIPLISEDDITTSIDTLIAMKAADSIIVHPDYSILSGRILMSRQSKLIGKPMQDIDYTYDFFAATTFLAKYSIRNGSTPTELPSCMYQRVSKYLAKDDVEYQMIYDELTSKKINFSTPIYTNAGVERRGSMISCNLTHLEGDSYEEIQNTINKIAAASKEGAGVGLLIDPIRSKDSLVSSFNGKAGGVIRLADMVQSTMRFYKQGSRAGSCALYLSLWHRDILDFLELLLPTGSEDLRTRDLFTAVVVNDLFMQKLEKDEDWYLFCPNDILKAGLKALDDVIDKEFEETYNKAVELGLGVKIKAKKIWDAIIRANVECGRPYVFFKENTNKRNMQKNMGVVKLLNLCAEIAQVSKPRYTPQCTLASLNLAEHDSIQSIIKSVKVLVRVLNRVIDKNKWSDDWSKAAGLDQRALAIGVAGLADFFAKKKISFESQEAKEWNHLIFEAMYKAAVEESMNMAIEEGRNYPAWEGSPYSNGETYIEGWSPLEQGKQIPMLNSLLIGLMPTASSAILLSVFESFEAVTSNLFTRRVGQGEFMVINKYLVKDLDELGLWDETMKDEIVKNDGSIQNIKRIPETIRHIYKTVYEIPQKCLLDLSIIRNKYVDQSQSLNVYYKDITYKKVSSALMYAWKNGLKTGVYYTRTPDKRGNNSKLSATNVENNEKPLPQKPKDSPFECFGCSS